jgi:ABC-type multidrug transport system ATPase subunit
LRDPAGTADLLIARADLGDVADRPAGALSTGTLQRLNLAIALAGAPRLLLLDEPTGTLSPDQRLRLWAWMDELVSTDDMALVFSTQSMEEAAGHADRVLVLAGGRVRHDGPAGAMDEAVFMALVEDDA